MTTTTATASSAGAAAKNGTADDAGQTQQSQPQQQSQPHPLTVRAVSAYLRPLLAKHSRSESVVYEDLLSSREAAVKAVDVAKAAAAFYGKKSVEEADGGREETMKAVDELHSSQLRAYENAARSDLSAQASDFADASSAQSSSSRYPPVDPNESLPNYVSRAVSSIRGSYFHNGSKLMMTGSSVVRPPRNAVARLRWMVDDAVYEEVLWSKVKAGARKFYLESRKAAERRKADGNAANGAIRNSVDAGPSSAASAASAAPAAVPLMPTPGVAGGAADVEADAAKGKSDAPAPGGDVAAKGVKRKASGDDDAGAEADDDAEGRDDEEDEEEGEVEEGEEADEDEGDDDDDEEGGEDDEEGDEDDEDDDDGGDQDDDGEKENDKEGGGEEAPSSASAGQSAAAATPTVTAADAATATARPPKRPRKAKKRKLPGGGGGGAAAAASAGASATGSAAKTAGAGNRSGKKAKGPGRGGGRGGRGGGGRGRGRRKGGGGRGGGG